MAEEQLGSALIDNIKCKLYVKYYSDDVCYFNKINFLFDGILLYCIDIFLDTDYKYSLMSPVDNTFIDVDYNTFKLTLINRLYNLTEDNRLVVNYTTNTIKFRSYEDKGPTSIITFIPNIFKKIINTIDTSKYIVTEKKLSIDEKDINNNIFSKNLEIKTNNSNILDDLMYRQLPLSRCFVIDLPPDFIIYNSLMVENINMTEYLQEDKENIVFITLLNNNTYQGFATNIEHVESSTNIVVECKEEGNSSKFMKKNNTFFDRWYVRLGLDEHNNNKGIFLDKLNSVRDEFDKGNKIFFLSEERTLKTISKLNNVIINFEAYTNIYDRCDIRNSL